MNSVCELCGSDTSMLLDGYCQECTCAPDCEELEEGEIPSDEFCGRCGHDDRLPIIDGFCPDCREDQDTEERECKEELDMLCVECATKDEAGELDGALCSSYYLDWCERNERAPYFEGLCDDCAQKRIDAYPYYCALCGFGGQPPIVGDLCPSCKAKEDL